MYIHPEPEASFGKLSRLFRGERSQDSSWSWVVCITAAVCNGIGVGFALSFGVLFPPLMEYFEETRERTALVGSAALGMTWFASPLPGYLCDRFGCRITALLGGVLCMTGLVSTSFAQSLTQMYFTHSLVLGFGTSLIHNSSFLVVGQYFKEKLSLSIGIVAMGASLGVLCTGPLLQALLETFAWRGTLRIMAASFAFVCLLSLVFNPNVVDQTAPATVTNNEDEGDEKRGIALYCSVWTVPTFTVVMTSFMFASFGMFIPYIILVKYSEDLAITARKASRLYIFIGLASTFGRLLSGRLCNEKRVNPVFIYQASLLIASISTFMLPFSEKYWHLITFSLVYGLSDGIFITTECFILVSCVDVKRRTAAFCINNALLSITVTAGGPIAGLIADLTGSYVYSFYITGGVLMTAFLIPMTLLVLRSRKSTVHLRNMEEAELIEKIMDMD